MFLRLLAAFIVSCAVHTACAQKSTFGKTNAQILKMGRQQWFGFYTSKAGESTMGMADAERIYGEALMERNDKLLPKESRIRQSAIKTIRKSARAVGDQVVMIGMAYSGGGTMWTPVLAGVLADVEEGIYGLLKKTKLTASERKAPSFATLEALLSKMGTDLATNKKELQQYSSPENDLYSQAVKAQKEAKVNFAAIVKASSSLRSSEKPRIAAIMKRLFDLVEMG